MHCKYKCTVGLCVRTQTLPITSYVAFSGVATNTQIEQRSMVMYVLLLTCAALMCSAVCDGGV